METAKRASTLVFRLKKLVRYFQAFCEPAVDLLGLLVVAVSQVSAVEWRGLDCPVDPAIGERFEQILLIMYCLRSHEGNSGKENDGYVVFQCNIHR
jgi:hypothetical protein